MGFSSDFLGFFRDRIGFSMVFCSFQGAAGSWLPFSKQNPLGKDNFPVDRDIVGHVFLASNESLRTI